MRLEGKALVFLTAVISGFSIFLNGFAVQGFNPFAFTTAKNLVVALLLGGVLLSTGKIASFKRLTKNQWLKLLAVAGFGGSLPFLLFFQGLQLGSAVSGAFIHKTLFLYASAMAFIFLREKVTRNQLLGMMVLFAGVFALNLPSLETPALADALVFLATLLWAVEAVIAKSALRSLPGNLVAFSRMFFGDLILLAFLFSTNQLPLLLSFTQPQLGWIALTAALLFGYVVTWYNGLKAVKVSLATSILLLGSALTATLNYVYTWNFSVLGSLGIILLLAGLTVVLHQDIQGFLLSMKQRLVHRA